jgi:hypothetical protein
VSSQSTSKPWQLRAMNWSGAAMGRLRPATKQLDVNELLSTARRQALLEDFGAPHFRDGLDCLVESLNDEADLNYVGRTAFRRQILQLLGNRLRDRDWVKKHPYIRHELVEAPLIVTGLPRTGTTLLSGVLNEDPFNRSIYGWEALAPCPPPNVATCRQDPRISAALTQRRRMDAVLPHLRAIHALEPTAPTECVTLLASDFASMQFETQAWIPAYAEWLEGTDVTYAYEHHKLQLMMFQAALPTERWALKSPMHLWHLDAVRSVYPDARLIWTHRDPVKAVPSVASLVTTLSSPGTDRDRSHQVGRAWLEKCVRGVEAGEAARAGSDDASWFDLPYAELVDDPVGAVERIYVHFGLELSQLGRRRMQSFVDLHPQDLHGCHKYQPADYGLDAATIRERFAGYISSREVPTEP